MLTEVPITRVLVVDDDPAILRLLRRVLGQEYDVSEAHDAPEAVGRLSQADFYAVVSDYEMPGPNGIWLLAEVRSRQPSARRILISGRNADDIHVAINSSVVDQFISKPFKPEAILMAVSSPTVHAKAPKAPSDVERESTG